MKAIPEELSELIKELAKLPGIGLKSATRIAFFLLRRPKEETVELANLLEKTVSNLKICSVCFNISDTDPCSICRDETRDRSVICVVEEPNDMFAIESAGVYNGLYHILGGAISPLDGINPENLRIRELIDRLGSGEFREIIIATNPDAEGDATALYLAKLLKPVGLKITRIARGLPTGGDIEFVDPTTLGKAIEGRREEF
ncbi:MAG: recombination mediator RecR [bacterium]